MKVLPSARVRMRDRASREDLITPCVSLLARLALDQLPPDWSDSVWDGQFTETADLPPDYEEVAAGADVGEVFSRLTETITRWIQTQSTGAAAEESREDMNTSSQSDLYRCVITVILLDTLKVFCAVTVLPVGLVSGK